MYENITPTFVHLQQNRTINVAFFSQMALPYVAITSVATFSVQPCLFL